MLISAKQYQHHIAKVMNWFFGKNGGQQCVAMSLYCLIYNTKQGIISANDLILIMNIGNQWYSSLSQLTTTTPLKHTLDSQKPTSKQDTEITPHHSATPSTKTPPNLANTSGHSRMTTLTILSHGASYHLTLPTTAPVKDATSA